MDNPLKVVLILGIYLSFVLNIGPKVMENRKAFSLRSVLLIYNFLQVILSLYIFFSVSAYRFLFTYEGALLFIGQVHQIMLLFFYVVPMELDELLFSFFPLHRTICF